MSYNVRKAIRDANIELEDLKDFIISMDNKLEKKLEECQNISSTLRLVDKECSLIDIELFCAVVENFQIEAAEKHIKEYCDFSREYFQYSPIACYLKERLIEVSTTYSLLQCESVTYIFDWEPSEELLDDIKDILAKLSGKLVKIRFIGIGESTFNDENKFLQLDAVSKWLQEGEVNLTVKRVQMLGPPCSGKTCSQHLLLNEDPPQVAVTDSTPITCRAVKATRISAHDNCMERVDAKALLSRLAGDLKESAVKQEGASSKQKKTTKEGYDTKLKKKSSETIPSDSPETIATESADTIESVDTADTEPADDPDAKIICKDIVKAIPKAKANLNCNWVYIVDSGGQTAFQELLPLFTRPASLNIITIDLSKDLDEKLDLQYRIDGKSFPCDSDFSYSNIEFIKDVLSSGAVSQPYHNKYPGYFVLGTHSDHDKVTPEKIQNYNDELSSLTSGYKAEKGYRIIPAKLGEIMYPVNTMLKSGPERQKMSKKLCDLILNDKNSNDTFPMPVRWFAFELTLLKKAGNGSCLKKHDVLSIGRSLEMEEKDTEQALLYLHNATIILYFPEVLPNLVFVDPHPILDTLSRLLALTYNIDVAHLSLLTKEGVNILDSDDLENLRKRGIFTKSLLDMLNGDKEFSTPDFIELLLHLHIIAKTNDGYFIPSALPPYTGPPPESDIIHPLLVVWRNLVTEEILPVPRGIFPLLVVNLRTFKQPEFRFPTKDTSTHQKYMYLRCRDAMSFRVFVHKEKIGTIHLIKKNKCIEIYFKGEVLKYCPLILEAVTEAINSSSVAINLKPDGHEFAFACCSKDCYRIVTNEAEEKVEYLCDESAIISGQEKYWSWLHVTYQNPNKGPKSLDIKDLREILKLLREGHFNGDWEGLGLELGLYKQPTLSNIQHSYTKGEAPLRECLTAWLQRTDAVNESGGATYASLANALDTIGQKAVADHIRKECQIHFLQEETEISTLKGTPHILDIVYLRDVRSSLKKGNFDDSKWRDLGAKLCLLPDTLKTIEDDYSNVSRRLRETLVKWLEGADGVSPSWGSLVKALDHEDIKKKMMQLKT
ncbi:PREDICTED: uncharacterized protein LOC109584221 [Amphimedon queenslandica]|uniref:Death domain-containing protein n=1 Tax=Amphimedon queenslandica TaxID=400682 RepID=A0A1X7U951_AMPQE|nr:PREDICTED: uncharacterized protein LOC109584221 [Amphimedon queenslandica]|eukprot:XP_019855439.1 PREDICTED: uncharacterized protein LOC109584221 [Amphimedon queenslandica]